MRPVIGPDSDSDAVQTHTAAPITHQLMRVAVVVVVLLLFFSFLHHKTGVFQNK